MMVAGSHNEQIAFLITIPLVVDDMLPLSPHNVLQLIMGMFVHG